VRTAAVRRGRYVSFTVGIECRSPQTMTQQVIIPGELYDEKSKENRNSWVNARFRE